MIKNVFTLFCKAFNYIEIRGELMQRKRKRETNDEPYEFKPVTNKPRIEVPEEKKKPLIQSTEIKSNTNNTSIEIPEEKKKALIPSIKIKSNTKVSSMLIVVSGGRNWNKPDVVLQAFDKIQADHVTLVHGDCRGLDRLAGSLAKKRGWTVIPKPANWSLGKKAGPIRNRQMLNMKPNLVILFHDDLKHSKGTKDVYDECRRKNIPYVLYS